MVAKNKRSDVYLKESGSLAAAGDDGGDDGPGWLERIDAQTVPLSELVSNKRNALSDREV